MDTRFSIFLASAALSLGLALPFECVQAQANCQGQDVMPEKNKTLILDQSGGYCLQGDLTIDDESIFQWHGTGRPQTAAELLHDDIAFDLQGRTIHIGDVTTGIISQGDYRLPRGTPLPPPPKRIAIRNGTIKVKAWTAVYSGFSPMAVPSDMVDPLEGVSLSGKSPEWIADSRQFWLKIHFSMLANQTKLRPATPADYISREIRLERLRIFAHGGKGSTGARDGAINLQGANTIIRDCIIETDAGTAIWIFGPNALIENNTIIVHGTNRQREADAPIRLIQADGAIIRNNKIVLRDEANRRAISTFDTGPITVENNTFYGLDKPDQVAQAFLGTLNLRESGSRFEPGWKGWFPGVR